MRKFLRGVFVAVLLAGGCLCAQLKPAAPPVKIEPPPPHWNAALLELRADDLREAKEFAAAERYLRAALAKEGKNAVLWNKLGITHLQMSDYDSARKEFERAVKLDRNYSEAFNNLGVTHYIQKNYKKAIKQYRRALALDEAMASYHSNLASAYFAQKQFANAFAEYSRALQLDPQILEHTSPGGVAAHLASPEERAHYAFVMAKLYARQGDVERALVQLRRAREMGYARLKDVYKDEDFTVLRKDARFAEMMGEVQPVSE